MNLKFWKKLVREPLTPAQRYAEADRLYNEVCRMKTVKCCGKKPLINQEFDQTTNYKYWLIKCPVCGENVFHFNRTRAVELWNLKIAVKTPQRRRKAGDAEN